MSDAPNRAVSWFIVAWITVGIAIIATAIRVYSRALITRSIGSDDFSLVISTFLTLTGAVINSAQFHYGLGRHEWDLTPYQIEHEQKWEYIAWIIVFINYFFLRLSILLFVLRLLPPFKKLEQRVVYVELFLSFAITLTATVTYGLGCIPFSALWTKAPDAKCFSKENLVLVAQVNGILSCVIDITTALVPVFLLRRVQMKSSTRLVLRLIFCSGVITAGMSIGRAVTSTKQSLTVDTTWNSLPSKWFGMIEDNFGVAFACAPSLRQLYTYYRRTGTLLPGEDRQRPNEDFQRWRRKVNIRDIFWYRQAVLENNKVRDAHPIFRHAARSDSESSHAPIRIPEAEAGPLEAQKSVMDWWEDKVKRIFARRSATRQ